jgi:predicted AlkP superfamily phosphohydrolase/phosphomutase
MSSVRARLLLACLLTISLAACGRVQSAANGKRIIVLGMDAMDPGFLERHWDALPNLDRLRRQGEFQRLATSVPPQSPVAWSTFTTGMDPGGHGIYDFVHRDPATLAPFSSMGEIEPPRRTLALGPYRLPLSGGQVRTFRKGKAFWSLLGEHGVPVTLLRMPNNFPPLECEDRTLALAGMGTPDMRGTFGTYTFFTDDPLESTRQTAGGRIVRVELDEHRAELAIEGPENTLRKDRRRTEVTMLVDRDPDERVARFAVGDSRLILRQGEWSGWVRAEFPLIRGLKSAAGMFRIYAKQLHPSFAIYVSPVNIDPAAPELPISAPGSYSSELAAATGPFYTQGIAEDTAALRDGVFTVAEYRRQSRIVSEEQVQLLRHALDQLRSGVLFFHFSGIDQDSHMLWGDHEDELLDTYRFADRIVGEVMEKAAGADLIVMSDHGFARFDRAVHLNTWLWQEGFLALDSPENAGRGELFAHVDWSRTQAYALGLNAVYVNQEGRERFGTVAPSESSEVVARIAERLKRLRDPKTGNTVIAAVYVPKSEYRSGALPSAPDLIVGYAEGYRASWQAALGGVAERVFEDNTEEWRGDHCMAAHLVPGVLLSNRRSRLEDPRLEDVTATLLAEFGVAPAPGIRGRPLFRAGAGE